MPRMEGTYKFTGRIHGSNALNLGDFTVTGHGLTAADVLIGNQLEVNGTLWADAATVHSQNNAVWLGGPTGGTDSAIFPEAVRGQLTFLVGSDHGNHLVFGLSNFITHDFAHASQIDPTIFIHSRTAPSTSTAQWLGLLHDTTGGVLSTGLGNLKLLPISNIVQIGDANDSGQLLFSWASGSDFSIVRQSGSAGSSSIRDGGATYAGIGITQGAGSTALRGIWVERISVGSNFGSASQIFMSSSSGIGMAAANGIDWPASGAAGGAATVGLRMETTNILKVTDGGAGLGILHANELRVGGTNSGIRFTQVDNNTFRFVSGDAVTNLFQVSSTGWLSNGGAFSLASGIMTAQSNSNQAQLRQAQDSIQAARITGSSDGAGEIACVIGTRYTDAASGHLSTLLRLATDATNATLASTVAKHEFYGDGTYRQNGAGSPRLCGLTSTAADPTTTEFPNDKDWGLHKNTNSGAVFLVYNDGGSTIKKVALT